MTKLLSGSAAQGYGRKTSVPKAVTAYVSIPHFFCRDGPERREEAHGAPTSTRIALLTRAVWAALPILLL
jgi:hypothetical protein